jgi:hypothetical protein
MSDKFITLCEDVAAIKANQANIIEILKEKPCIKHSESIEGINKKLWFFGGITATVSFLISYFK